MKNYFRLNPIYILFLSLSIFLSYGCGDDDDPMTGGEMEEMEESGDLPVATYQFSVDPDDFLTVIFENFSVGATSFAWDYGDGNTSDEAEMTHEYTYAASGDYTVSLTATNEAGSRTFSNDISLDDPNDQLNMITGGDSKVWKLSRFIAEEEFPLVVGPAGSDEIWWAFGREDPLPARPCLMEEEYIFHADGTYEYDSKGMVFADFGVWSVDVEGECIDDTDASLMVGANGEDLTPWGAGTFTYDFDPVAGTLTLNGLGAHVGLPKVGNDREYSEPQPSVTYRVANLNAEGSVDKMSLETTLVEAGGTWAFNLVSYENPADEPALGAAVPTASFDWSVDGRTVTFVNTSNNADSFMWDFGDGNSSSEESPTHTYSEDGNYEVTLTASNADGNGSFATNVPITTSEFNAEALHGGDTKTWRLAPTAGALAVGPGLASSEWWSNTEDDITVRSCTFDDTYTFSADGSFIYETNGDLWAEEYMGIDPPGCITDDMLPASAQAWGSGNHAFNVEEPDGTNPAFLTVSGTGAFIGIPKAFNGGEYTAGPPAENGMIRYQVVGYLNTADQEALVIAVDISADQSGSAFWTYALVAE